MAIPVLILGQSGTGKSYSMKNFKEDEICLISVQKSLLPFRKKFNEVTVTDSYTEIIKAMKKTDKKVIVIDDTQYLMCNEFMRRATEKGFDKFTEIAQNFWSLVVQEVNNLADDVIVYLLCHTSTDDNGVEKMKTIGKLVDEKITPEGLFTIVLKTAVSDGQYYFITQNNGKDTVKSPEEMFSTYAIKNDLKYVDEKIRNYYELGDHLSDEEIAEHDVEAQREDIEPPKSKSERKRKARNSEPVVDTINTPPMTDAPEPKSERKQRKTREEVEASNDDIIANTNLDDTCEDIPFDVAEVPAVEAPPRRRRRRAAE